MAGGPNGNADSRVAVNVQKLKNAVRRQPAQQPGSAHQTGGQFRYAAQLFGNFHRGGSRHGFGQHGKYNRLLGVKTSAQYISKRNGTHARK